MQFSAIRIVDCETRVNAVPKSSAAIYGVYSIRNGQWFKPGRICSDPIESDAKLFTEVVTHELFQVTTFNFNPNIMWCIQQRFLFQSSVSGCYCT